MIFTLRKQVEELKESHINKELTPEQKERLHNIFEPYMTDEHKAKTAATIVKIGKAPEGRQARHKWLKDLFEEGRENVEV